MNSYSLPTLIFLLFLSISALANPICTGHYLKNIVKRTLAEVADLNVGTFNVLNLTKSTGYYKTINGKRVFISGEYDKPMWQVLEIANIIKESKLDIIVLEEVEGMRALRDFNKKYLDDLYEEVCIKGNDGRGIEIAFLIKKDLPISYTTTSHKHLTWKNPNKNYAREPLFSRDLPVLKIYFRDHSQQGPPDLILIGTHYKSQREELGDPLSFSKRKAQVDTTASIIKNLNSQYNNRVPILLAGDFNSHVTNPEFAALYKDNLLKDSFDLQGLPLEDRITHTFHPWDDETKLSQLDAIMMTPSFSAFLKHSEVYRYKDSSGAPKKIPTTMSERNRNPSDHFMVKVVLDLKAYLGF